MFIPILAWFETVYQSCVPLWEHTKQSLRTWLGPAPQKLYLCSSYPDVSMIPISGGYVFSPDRNQIYSEIESQNDETPKRLPWLSIVYSSPTQTFDFSDWVCKLRSRVPFPPLIQFIRLGALVHNVYLPERDAKVSVFTRSGEEHQYLYDGLIHLVKQDE